MITRCYAVYDAAVCAFLAPFMARADGEAQRMFLSACADPKSPFSSNYRDYSLWYLSEFNDSTGEYGVSPEDKLSVPRNVLTGVAAMRMLEKQVPLPFSAPVDVSDVGEGLVTPGTE